MKNNKYLQRHNFSKIPTIVEYPSLLEIQTKSFKDFLQEDVAPEERKDQGLQSVFLSMFPIVDNRENFILDFVGYSIDKPKYSIEECKERGLTYSVPLKAKLRLSIKDPSGETEEYTETIEQDVFLGNLPYMTSRGSFIINGAERVIVNQLHRSPGVFFDESRHPNGTIIYEARVIPFRGSWLEFMTDINNHLFVYIDRKKKFYVTTFLKALGFDSDRKILESFDLIEDIEIKKSNMDKLKARVLADDIVDNKTGEIVYPSRMMLPEDDEALLDVLEKFKEMKMKSVSVWVKDDPIMPHLILNTMRKDTIKTPEQAIEHIYRQLRATEPPDIETARSLLERMFFNPKRYDLGNVGRYRLNKKFNLDIDTNITVLTQDDFVSILKYLIDLREAKASVDDIDHLGNRRIRTVGEQLAQQYLLAFTRMTRNIKEKMNIGTSDSITPQELVNARTVSSVINSFFGTSQLSQFMDQTNPLAEMTHKRRLSALGPGGLSRERAGFEVRDIHYTHYGRLCPIETPEGPNIGLITSLAVLAKVNEFGFIETPYRVVENGKVTNKIEYLSAPDEDRNIIAQFNAPVDEKTGKFIRNRVNSRLKGDFPVVTPEEVKYIDVAPNQVLSASASLIPFLEHDDANRALMGSNMQRQAVPLLMPETPIVGTGMEGKVAEDSGTMILSDVEGVVEKVDAGQIVIKVKQNINDPAQILRGEADRRVYTLRKFHRTNQNTCVNQRPLVKEGDKVSVGTVLADGAATQFGELALGRNVLVAFMPWNGYNFEDAIVLSEKLVQDDVFTSVHVEEFEIQVRDTKRGEEEFTREIPNVSEEATKDLDENGVIRIGAEVKAGDILVGKVTPKGETDPTPEEKLLKAIFGSKAGDVKDASLRVPPGMTGVVIDKKLFSRKQKDAKTKKENKKQIERLELESEAKVAQLKERLQKELTTRFKDKATAGIKTRLGKTVVKKGEAIPENLFDKVELEMLNFKEDWFDSKKDSDFVRSLLAEYKRQVKDIEADLVNEKHKIAIGDELQPGIVQLAKVYVAQKRKIRVGDKMAGRHGNKGVVSKVVPVEDMPFLADGTPVDIVLNPLGVPSRMNLGQIFETTLGWAGKVLDKYYATPVFDGATYEEVQDELEKAGLPRTGKMRIYNGQTGELFTEETTIGYIYMIKLSHMVDDKIHARAIGPYSLITQQPLGGKAQFGGQRFGEMEVWALEAYGAAYTLQEMLTVKSDDVNGRTKTYESIVKGENLPDPGIPESFNVLLRELQGLGLEIKIE
ncbi:MAG: DNA-directed RNA polymerase subunit beta [Calditrichia bacterium]